jgi:hypothetical protein
VLQLQLGLVTMLIHSGRPLFAFGLLVLGIIPVPSSGFRVGSGEGVPPPKSEQEALLASMRRYAEDYIGNLPNFTCDQVTEQFESGRKANRWHKGDTLTSKLIFNEGREQRSLQLVNDKPLQPGRRLARTPLATEGEFGILLSNVMGEASKPVLTWNRWEAIGDRRLAVFGYAIDAQHSTMRLGLSSAVQAVVAYHGQIFADPATGIVWRITNVADDIPEEVKTRSISTTVHYGQVTIASNAYVLPVHATVLLNTGSSNIRNEMEFKNYRKFGADSTIIYSNPNPSAESEPRNQSPR